MKVSHGIERPLSLLRAFWQKIVNVNDYTGKVIFAKKPSAMTVAFLTMSIFDITT
jgi:hypothetical protein